MSTIGSEFLSKLIQDVRDGLWDGGFSVNSNGTIYTFTAPKQILTKSNFSLDVDGKGKELDSGVFVFSNGYGVSFENLVELRDEVLISLERTVVRDMHNYDGPIVVETNTIEPIATKPDVKQNKIGEK